MSDTSAGGCRRREGMAGAAEGTAQVEGAGCGLRERRVLLVGWCLFVD